MLRSRQTTKQLIIKKREELLAKSQCPFENPQRGINRGINKIPSS
jgi:hypothetical protein